MYREALLDERGTDVVALTGRGDGDAPEAPLAPVVDSLRGARQDSARRVLPYLLARAQRLSAILPELSATRLGPHPPPPDGHLLFDCLLQAVGEAAGQSAGRSAALWVLDDMHFADSSTWSFVRHASHRIRRLPIVLVVAYRPDEVVVEGGVAALAELAQTPCVTELRLERLDPSQTEELVRSVAPTEPAADRLTSIAERSAGNPAIAAELACAGPDGARAVPPSVRAYAGARLAALSPAARDLLELVAAIGGRAHLELLSGIWSTAADQALADLLGAGLVRVEDDAWLRCDYPLLAEAVYEQIPRPRRRAIHQEIADVVGRGAPPPWTEALDLARHRELGGDPRAAFEDLLTAAESARVEGHAGRAGTLHLAAEELSDRHEGFSDEQASQHRVDRPELVRPEPAHQEAAPIDAAAVPPSTEAPDAAASGARSGISSRELQIAELIAQGLTNRAIAHRLYLSPYTVGTHVKNLLAKLQFRSRAQIGAWLADHSHRVSGARARP
jgi:DNA-binding CsgD family transcriptional regulator